MTAKDRPFTQLAADVCGYRGRLDAGQCPFCGCDNPEATLMDELSRKEFAISQLCQGCQNEFFGKHGGKEADA